MNNLKKDKYRSTYEYSEPLNVLQLNILIHILLVMLCFEFYKTRKIAWKFAVLRSFINNFQQP
jgi:hypothetical protein